MRPFDVGADATTGVLLEEYDRRPFSHGGFDDPNLADIIRRLEVRCIDRLYLHASMPKLQTSGGLLLLARLSPASTQLWRDKVR